MTARALTVWSTAEEHQIEDILRQGTTVPVWTTLVQTEVEVYRVFGVAIDVGLPVPFARRWIELRFGWVVNIPAAGRNIRSFHLTIGGARRALRRIAQRQLALLQEAEAILAGKPAVGALDTLRRCRAAKR